MNKKHLAAAGKILHHCTICKKFHASYLVDDPELGKSYLCYSCWKAKNEVNKESQGETEREDRDHEQ